jgi:hypothetical protein
VLEESALSPVARLVVEATKYAPDILVCDAEARKSFEAMDATSTIDESSPAAGEDCGQEDDEAKSENVWETPPVPVERSILEMALSSRLTVIMLK